MTIIKKILNYTLPGIFLFFLAIGLSCEKEKEYPDGRFIGTWVSLDQQVTLIFISDDIFLRSAYDGIKHTFIYSYTNDSITAQYKGPNMILVQPSTHHYELKGNSLRIDYTNGSYGFEKKVLDYSKD